MNILLITSISGFLPKFLWQDVKNLQNLGHSIYYASNFNKPVYECNREELEKRGIHCYHIPVSKDPLAFWTNYAAYRQLVRIVRRKDIQAVYCHNPMGGVLGRLLTFADKNLYVIYTAHGFHFYKGAPLKNWLLYYPVEKLLARRTDLLITINHEDKILAEGFHLRVGGGIIKSEAKGDNRVYHIPGIGLDAKRFCPDRKNRDLIRGKLGVSENEFIFLSVGELNDNKNHITVMKAFAELNAENARLFICGRGPNRPGLEKWIKKHRLENRIILWGYQTKIEKFYQAADCFLFPSIREGLGMASIEAMACGLPLIVGDNRGTREYAFDNAIKCEPMDRKAFAAAMKKIMDDPALAADMGMKSLKIADGFTREKTNMVMQDVYKRVNEQVNQNTRE